MQLIGEQEMFSCLYYYQYVLMYVQMENAKSVGGGGGGLGGENGFMISDYKN